MPTVRKTRMVVIKKRSAKEWMEGDNLVILRGRAMQCLSYTELAESIGITPKTLEIWRKKYPLINETIELGRQEADDIVLALTHDQAVGGNEAAMDRWWKYRIAPKLKADEESESMGGGVTIVDDL